MSWVCAVVGLLTVLFAFLVTGADAFGRGDREFLRYDVLINFFYKASCYCCWEESALMRLSLSIELFFAFASMGAGVISAAGE